MKNKSLKKRIEAKRLETTREVGELLESIYWETPEECREDILTTIRELMDKIHFENYLYIMEGHLSMPKPRTAKRAILDYDEFKNWLRS